MCIFSNIIINVDDTNIFCGVNNNRTKQIIIYSNKVNTNNDNVMILPVLNPETIKFHDLSYYPNFFNDCYYSFEIQYFCDGFGGSIKNNCLKVEKSGSYLYSLAMNKEDIKRVDVGTFDINVELDNLLDEYEGYGFIICKMMNDEIKYEPLCYSHNIDNEIFIPTRHYHMESKEDTDIKDNEEWKHNIYLHNIDYDNLISEKIENKLTTKLIDYYIDNKLLSTLGFNLIEDENKFYKIEINGNHKNIDLKFSNEIIDCEENIYEPYKTELLNYIKKTKQQTIYEASINDNYSDY